MRDWERRVLLCLATSANEKVTTSTEVKLAFGLSWGMSSEFAARRVLLRRDILRVVLSARRTRR